MIKNEETKKLKMNKIIKKINELIDKDKILDRCLLLQQYPLNMLIISYP